jgi:predicted cupin superfamily sugar epimerase
MLSAAKIRELLKMEELRTEGGYFAETYKSELMVPAAALPPSCGGDRSVASAIYYLLTPDTFSALHRLRGDEMFHFYLGDPVEMLQLREDGTGETVLLGQDIASGMRLQHVVPGGVWQGSRLVAGGEYALLGTTVSPGFEYEDYETGRREELVEIYPGFEGKIVGLTR